MGEETSAILESLRNLILSLGTNISEEIRPHRFAYYVGGLQIFADLFPMKEKVQVTVYVKRKGAPPLPTRLEVRDAESFRAGSELLRRAWSSYTG